ncbi:MULTISPECIES: excinuclease ABC subunit UvrB [Pseudomonadaceae]|jgi:excinuclease ABC subunit B|uniref:Excinuclease ABC subunit UvrB n=4 Tax=Pseudomonas TaxID=286 RepID=A0A7Y8AUL1_PSETO|nr:MULTISPECIES: excinuclease ABC subunit UvrB [Pseudomonadaceae]MBF4560330.1 excinuclease ABC subunit UvrB [Pseudomonas sp. p50(2008)]MBF6043588.1 excinuclease ABC subunit UvrB [Pseudomonas mucoides]MBK3915705.1 excinuclease ABC subunit UvrB [Stutzerimonas frequens]MBX9410532.1 excinuclease ABC subunit UvrB [Pseudomonas baetica]MCT8950797.1 excinuclease ABC subunit UvrB [Pseudomonas iridis]
MSSGKFILHSNYTPAGDQPEAVARLISGIEEGATHQMLKGITGSGKTFTMANVIHRLKRPTLILAPNKTLTAQLYSEMKNFFPENAVEYFVSYYDYFQPEVYMPGSDRFIQKDSAINEHLERLRLSTTKSLIERRDVIVVASVSSIYGLGDPDSYRALQVRLARGVEIEQGELIRKLALLQYDRVDRVLRRGSFRVRGDIIDIFPADSEHRAIRVVLLDDYIELVQWLDPITGKLLEEVDSYLVSPKTLFVTPRNKIESAAVEILAEMESRVEEFNRENRLVEANRLYERVTNDVEMMRELGYCSGIENYSCYMNERDSSLHPTTLLDYLPKDGLLFIDESHVMVPQISAMYRGDQSRKETLIDYGFRLPSSKNNRPLSFEEFEGIKPQAIFVSATPGPYELKASAGRVVEQVIRPTGLLDPEVEVRPLEGRMDDLLREISVRVQNNERVLVTALTKVEAEDLSTFMADQGVRVRYMHSDTKADARVEIINGLRAGDFDVLIGVSLLREGLDIPEASLVAILDADRAGFLRSAHALIQMIGRVARNQNGTAILYADTVTPAMQEAIDETKSRRERQIEFNKLKGISPVSSVRKMADEATLVVEPVVHSSKFCENLSTLCELITNKEQELLEYTDRHDDESVENIRVQLDALYRQFIYM